MSAPAMNPVLERVRRSRKSQGLPPTVRDGETIRRVAELLGPAKAKGKRRRSARKGAA